MRQLFGILALGAIACGPAVSADENNGDGASAGSASTGSSSGPGSPPSPQPSASGTTTTAVPDSTSSSTGSSSTGDPFGGFIDDPNDVPYGEECSIYEQDCAEGFKCIPFLPEGVTNIWGQSGCFPLNPDPVGLGEACTYQDEAYSGHDNCPERSFCNRLDETGEGYCSEFCSEPNNPTCSQPDTVPYVGCQECECICEPTCSPLASDCPDGWMCVVAWELGTCAPDASGDAGYAGDPCEFINACKPGLTCVEGSFVTGCETGACCTPYCDVTDPMCPEGSECSGIWDEGTAPPDLENLGWCLDPTAE